MANNGLELLQHLTLDEFYQKREILKTKPVRVAYLLALLSVYHVLDQRKV